MIYTIDVVFFRMNDISISRITILAAIWSVAALVTEIPTGVLADRWSRKYMLALSSVFAALGFLVFSVSSSFSPFVLATLLLAARISFGSGTDDAFLYDSLKEMGKASDYERIRGRCNLLEVASLFVAGVIGAYLAVYNIRIPFILSLVTSALAGVIALSFKEPRIHTLGEKVNVFEHIRRAGKQVIKQPFIRFVFFYWVLMDVATSLLDEYDQLYLTEIGFPLAMFGVWIGIRRGLYGVGSMFAEKFKRKPSSHSKLVALFAVILSLGAVALCNMYVGLAAFMLVFALWGVAEVLISGEIHSRVESQQRATIESLLGVCCNLAGIPVLLGFGWVSEAFGIRTGYGALMILLALYAPYFLARKSILASSKSS